MRQEERAKQSSLPHVHHWLCKAVSVNGFYPATCSCGAEKGFTTRPKTVVLTKTEFAAAARGRREEASYLRERAEATRMGF